VRGTCNGPGGLPGPSSLPAATYGPAGSGTAPPGYAAILSTAVAPPRPTRRPALLLPPPSVAAHFPGRPSATLPSPSSTPSGRAGRHKPGKGVRIACQNRGRPTPGPSSPANHRIHLRPPSGNEYGPADRQVGVRDRRRDRVLLSAGSKVPFQKRLKRRRRAFAISSFCPQMIGNRAAADRRHYECTCLAPAPDGRSRYAIACGRGRAAPGRPHPRGRAGFSWRGKTASHL